MGGTSTGDRLLAVLAHASFFFLPIILPLILVLLGNTDGFVRHHARQALICHLFLAGASLVAGLLCIVAIGFVLLPLIGIYGLVITIIAIVRTVDGEVYRYPICGYWFE